MTREEWLRQCAGLLASVAESDDEESQRAHLLLQHLDLVSSAPAADLDRQILAALGLMEQGLRGAKAWASERTRT